MLGANDGSAQVGGNYLQPAAFSGRPELRRKAEETRPCEESGGARGTPPRQRGPFCQAVASTQIIVSLSDCNHLENKPRCDEREDHLPLQDDRPRLRSHAHEYA